MRTLPIEKVTLPHHLFAATPSPTFLFLITMVTGTPTAQVCNCCNHVAVGLLIQLLLFGHDKPTFFFPSLYRYYTRFTPNVSLVPNPETIKELVNQVGL